MIYRLSFITEMHGRREPTGANIDARSEEEARREAVGLAMRFGARVVRFLSIERLGPVLFDKHVDPQMPPENEP